MSLLFSSLLDAPYLHVCHLISSFISPLHSLSSIPLSPPPLVSISSPLEHFSLSELIPLELVAAMSVSRVLMQLHDSLEF